MAFVNHNKHFVKTKMTSLVHLIQNLLKYHGLIYLDLEITFNDISTLE